MKDEKEVKEVIAKRLKTISFRVDEETYNLFQAMAKAFGCTTSELFREMLEIGTNIVKRSGKIDDGDIQ